MRTVISAFDDRRSAQSAIDRLVEAGFSREDIHLQPDAYADDDYAASNVATTAKPVHEDHGMLDKIGNFFSNLFDSDTPSGDAGTYAEAVRRGSIVVVVDVDDEDDAEAATEIMESLGAVDVDERSSEWKSAGWTGFDPSAEYVASTDVGTASTLRDTTSVGEPKTVMKVVQEELQVGKRTVDRGGVRVIERVSQTPVREMIKLREERATIERRPVDRPATDADFAAFKEGSIEVRESTEEAVVGKTARVVEEVLVGKEVQERTETIDETVRRKDVDIERLDERGSTPGSSSFDKT